MRGFIEWYIRNKTNRIKSNEVFSTIFTVFFFTLSTLELSAKCSLIDQQNLAYNGGMSARNLAGYSEWQSFRVTESGMLCKIDVGLFNFMNGTGIFRIYEGIGIAGSILSEDTVLISGDGNFFFPFDVYVPVTASSNYTFHLIPILGGGLPDPYGVQVENPGSYSSGDMYIVDPSGSYSTGFDMIFKTYLEINTGMEHLDKAQNLILFPNPMVDKTNLISSSNFNSSFWLISDIQGKEICKIPTNNQLNQTFTRTNEIPGVYFVSLVNNNQRIFHEKLIIIP